MPVMDGIEATRLIRSKGWTKEMLPIVGLTASFQTAELASYQEMGMNDCIGKPVRLDALNGIIHRLVNLSLETEEKV
jgi:CheY-like chemotaxis protein